MRKERVKRLQSFAQSCRFDFSSKILDKIYSTIKYDNQQIMDYQIIRMQVDNLKDAILYDKKYDGFYLRWQIWKSGQKSYGVKTSFGLLLNLFFLRSFNF